jgi:hypothetical protein
VFAACCFLLKIEILMGRIYTMTDTKKEMILGITLILGEFD